MEQKFSKTLDELKDIAINGNKERNLDLFLVDPRLIVSKLGHNVRDFESVKVKEHIRYLADNIRENGVMTPLECRRGEKVGTFTDEKGKVYDLCYWILIDGECRKRAVDLLIEEGIDFKAVPVIQEKKGSNEANRVLDMLNANIGLRFAPIELAHAYQRLINWKYTIKEIAKSVGKTEQHVRDCLELLNLSPIVQKGLFDEKVTANNVRKMQQKYKDVDPNQRQTLIDKGLETAMKRANKVSDKEKAGKYIDLSKEENVEPTKTSKRGRPKKTTKKIDNEIFIDYLKYLIELLPGIETLKLSDLKDIIEMLEDGKPLHESIEIIFNN